MSWRYEVLVVPRDALWRVSVSREGVRLPAFVRDHAIQAEAVDYAIALAVKLTAGEDTAAVLLRTGGATELIWPQAAP